MQVLPSPGSLPDSELNFAETARRSSARSWRLAPRSRSELRDFRDVADKCRTRRVSFNGDLSSFFDNFVVQGQGDVHVPVSPSALDA
jgi:hypothetical protein